MSEFLKKMEESLEEGKFNSEIADKINEINKKADEFAKGKSVEEMKEVVEEKATQDGVVTVDEGQVPELNSDFEKKMELMKREDRFNNTVANIMNLDDFILKHVDSLKSEITGLEEEFGEEREERAEAFKLVDDITERYK
jgi:hypothetical protein